MKKSVHSMVEVRHSPVHGYGVFASRRIRKGTTIMEYLGDRVSHEEADTRYENKAPDDNHTFLFTVDSKIVIDGGVDGNDARFINHGCDPNCESASQSKRIFVEAIRTIRPGEELTYDYQIQRDPDDPPNVDEIFACRCGADKCRGSMLVARKKPRKKGAGAKLAQRSARDSVSKLARKSVAKSTRKSTRLPGRKVRGEFPSTQTKSRSAEVVTMRGIAKRDTGERAAARQGAAKRDAAKRRLAKYGAANRGAAKRGAATRGAAKHGAATRGGRLTRRR